MNKYNKIMKLEYPINLLTDIFNGDNGKDFKSMTQDTRNRIIENNNLEEAILTLTTKEQIIIRLRFCQHLTLKEVAIRQNLSEARIGQILNKALRKLRHNSRHKIILKNNYYLIHEDKYIEDLKIHSKIKSIIENNPNLNENLLKQDIAFNEFSVRLYNRLKNARIRTNLDIINNFLSPDGVILIYDILKIRGLGIVLADELVDFMKTNFNAIEEKETDIFEKI